MVECSRGFGTMLFWELVGAHIAWERLPAFCSQGKAGWFQGEAGGGVSFLHDFNGLAQKPIRQKGNAEAKKMRRCPPLS